MRNQYERITNNIISILFVMRLITDAYYNDTYYKSVVRILLENTDTKQQFNELVKYCKRDVLTDCENRANITITLLWKYNVNIS